MKKAMWIVAMVPTVVTGFILQFLPDQIPMHYDLAGNTDRWGNKAESFISPVIILLLALFWHLMINAFEKKVVNAKAEKEQMEAKSNAKLLGIVGVSQTAMFGVMHFVILYGSWLQADLGSEKTAIDIAKLSCILCGILFLVLGNFMAKAKKNAIVGLRTGWSMYNDNTWRKSNRFGAVALVFTGLLTVFTTVWAGGNVSTILMLVYLLAAVLAAVLYSKRVYEQEIKG